MQHGALIQREKWAQRKHIIIDKQSMHTKKGNYYRGVGAYTMYYANRHINYYSCLHTLCITKYALTNVCKIKTASIRGEPEKHDCAEDIHLR